MARLHLPLTCCFASATCTFSIQLPLHLRSRNVLVVFRRQCLTGWGVTACWPSGYARPTFSVLFWSRSVVVPYTLVYRIRGAKALFCGAAVRAFPVAVVGAYVGIGRYRALFTLLPLIALLPILPVPVGGGGDVVTTLMMKA
jgi:hypothetical protein